MSLSSPELGPVTTVINLAEQAAARAAANGAAVLEISRIGGLPDGFFNAAAWPIDDSPDSRIALLGRLVPERSAPGQPDVGSLGLAIIGNAGVTSLMEVWKPETDRRGDLLEDPRSITSDDGSDRLDLGVTRLSPFANRYKPYPAFAVTTTAALLNGDFPPTHHIMDLCGDPAPARLGDPNRLYMPPGKNATPLGSGSFMFRPEVDNHEFLVFLLDENGGGEAQQRLVIPPEEIPGWGKHKMGSTMPPVWLNRNEAVLLVHGIEMVDTKCRYAIGSARLFRRDDGMFAIDNISPKAHLTPESFTSLYPGEQIELRPEERQAVYLCGGVAVRAGTGRTPDFIKTFPNIGDTRTGQATFSIPAITRGWSRAEPAIAVQLIAA